MNKAKWGDKVIATNLAMKNGLFKTYKPFGIYLGRSRRGLLRVVIEDRVTVTEYHEDYWVLA